MHPGIGRYGDSSGGSGAALQVDSELIVEDFTRLMADGSLTAIQISLLARMGALVPTLQRAMLRSDHGPMRAIWRLAYAAAARAYVARIRRGEPGSASYLRGTMASRGLLPGLSDIDVVVVTRPDAEAPGVARDRVRARLARRSRWLPAVGGALFDNPTVCEEPDLRATTARTTFTYGLDTPQRECRAAYWGPDADVDKQRWLERPELYGRRRAWRRIAGPELRPAEPPQDDDIRCVAAWLELQNWWRWAFSLCIEPNMPRSAYLSVKLIAEPVRVWLWLTCAERVGTRMEALRRGPREFPQEAAAFGRALKLHAALRRMPEPPLAELMPAFLRLSATVAQAVQKRAAAAGCTDVRLIGHDDELALPHGGSKAETWARLREGAPRLLALADWRALVAPIEPDESFAMIEGDPGDPYAIAAAATALDRGPYPTLSGHGLMVRPAPMGGRSRLRSVQCRATDPVSFALAEDGSIAPFPQLPGWSIEDAARRAVAEHAAWLSCADESDERRGTVLGRLITATRAALIWESIQEGEPCLPLTVDATLASLAWRVAGAAGLADAVRVAYHDFALNWVTPAENLIRPMRSVLCNLPAYAVRRPLRQAA